MLTGAKSAAARMAIAGLCILPALSAGSAGARALPGSVRLPGADGVSIGRARIVRTALTPGELSAPLSFSVTLRMREFSGLQARIAGGARVADPEMEARYLPLRADYDRVAAWLGAQGFTQTLRDRSHTSVFVQGSVAQVARAFGSQFARVAAPDGEYTSAISAPSVPGDLAAVVLSVNGLQPQFRLRHIRSSSGPFPQDLAGGLVYVTPDNVASAYNFPATATGAGQVIAIVGEAPVLGTDLSAFWSATGIARTPASVESIVVAPAPGPSPADDLTREADLDVEWAGAMAPGAGIRLYVSQNVFSCFAQIQDDAAALPAMSVVSISFADTEGDEGVDTLQAYSQVFATFAAEGISVLCGSGDSGSNPQPGGGAGTYAPSQPLAVSYPASDPSVTGVGGTDVGFEANWTYTGESVWNDIARTKSASGGGVSGYFQKPAWQSGGAVLAGQSMRCVPDVAAISVGNLLNVNLPGFEPYTFDGVGVLIVDGGASDYASGTSLACPVWAAVAALVNQARAAAGRGPIGLLNPHLYPLAGTDEFNDITSGTNGAYAAGPGYNLCTGLGSPDVGNLVLALSDPPADPSHRLVDISTRAQVGTGSNVTIAGIVIRGPAGTLKNILVRGVGPALTGFGISGALAQPVVGVYDSAGGIIASDSGWGNAPQPGTSAVAASYRQATADEMGSVGAFALAAGSADSAMVLSLPPGAYTVQLSGPDGGSGVGLAEVYELDPTSPDALVNISARCFVGTGSGVAIPGFVVEGSQSAQLLIRGVGPALGQSFGLTGVLATPSIALNDSSGALIATNTGWGSPPTGGTSSVAASFKQATAADMASAGAFALPAGSADAAMIVTLPPGLYTAIVSGAGGATGTCLAEVYQLTDP
ncbi:MAG: S53 family peptidase [Opitutaceae bacterium]|jgi:kumamolisin